MTKRTSTTWDMIVSESLKGVRIWVGVDVHKKKYSVAVFSETGVLHHFVAPADNQGLIEQFKSREIRIEVLVYEAGLTGFGLYRACEAAGIPAMVVSANRIPRPATQSAKSDRIDCIALAKYAAMGLLKGIAVPTEEQEAARSIIRRRHAVSRELGKTKVIIKSFLTCHDLPEPAGLKTWNAESRRELEKMPMLPGLRVTLDSLLRQLSRFEEEKRLLERDVKLTLPPKGDVLQTMPGVGPITSATFRAELFSPDRFERSEKLTSFIGLAPVVSQSGEGKGKSRLVPCGQGSLRSMLVEAAWILRGKESWASEFYDNILRRCGVFQKAIVALARRLAVILWRMWLENRPYQSKHMQSGL